MASADGRWIMVFNGEIYNHLDLRRELAGPWRGHSDTETLLAAIAAWGLAATLPRLVGMYAFAVWDDQERVLLLARDRLGEKPLYLGGWEGGLAFASELKSLHLLPGCCHAFDPIAISAFLRHGYVPGANCIWRGARKLPPGTWLRLRPGDDPLSEVPIPYWSAADAGLAGESSPFPGDDIQAVNELERLLHQAVAGQMISDVPIGAFLSGGIDSSTIAALMQAHSRRPIRTFSIGFAETSYDESPHAAAVARHLGTDHTTLTVTPADALATIPHLADAWDEPFADPSQIPTLLLARLTRNHVTVALSGDGGDELFAGYSRYFWTKRLWNTLGWMPLMMRRGLAKSIRISKPIWWPSVDLVTGRRHLGDKTLRLAELLDMPDGDAFYQRMISHSGDPWGLLTHESGGHAPFPSCQLREFVARMQWRDLVDYLPDDILVKVDRAAMSASLETRVPMLDHRVVEFAARLPMRLRVCKGQGKWVLRQVLYRHVPRNLVDRPKMGFGIPLGSWLRGPLRDWAESLLDEHHLRDEGIFRPESVRRLWDRHLTGQRDESYRLWDILMFQEWRVRWGG